MMVTRNDELRARREYSLTAVNRLAKRKQVQYRTQKAENDANNLGYPRDAVCACLCGLRESHYHHSVAYHDAKKTWYDVYKCDYSPPAKPGTIDSLYIKLKLNRDCNVIELVSFHLS